MKNGQSDGSKEAERWPKARQSSRTSKLRLHFTISQQQKPPEMFLHSGLRGLFLEAVLSEGGGRGGVGIFDKLIISLSN